MLWDALPSALDLARFQFAFTVTFHFLFPALTIVLAEESDTEVAPYADVLIGLPTVPTLLQHIVPDELRGRVFSVQNVVLTALNILGMGAAGVAAELAPVQTIMVVGGAVSLFGGLIGFWVLRESHRP